MGGGEGRKKRKGEREDELPAKERRELCFLYFVVTINLEQIPEQVWSTFLKFETKFEKVRETPPTTISRKGREKTGTDVALLEKSKRFCAFLPVFWTTPRENVEKSLKSLKKQRK